MTTADEADKKARLERARETGLFRYSLVQELLEPGLSLAERGWRAREMAARVHEGPGGRRVTVSYSTLTPGGAVTRRAGSAPWCRPRASPRPDPGGSTGAGGGPEAGEAGAGRGAGAADLAGHVGVGAIGPDAAAAVRAAGAEPAALGPQEEQRAFGRFGSTRPNEMWTGDTLHGLIGGAKSYLFAFVDDHSRAVMGARWAHHDDVVRMAAAFRPALQARSIPKSAYLDNGSAFVDAWLLRGCAVLGIRLIHSRPGKPPLTGQSLDQLPVNLLHVNREPDRRSASCHRRSNRTTR